MPSLGLLMHQPCLPCPPQQCGAQRPVCFNQHYVCQRAYLRRWESLCAFLQCREDKPRGGAGEEMGGRSMSLWR